MQNLRERSRVPSLAEHHRYQSWRGQEEEEGVSKALAAVTCMNMKGTSERKTLHCIVLAFRLGRAGPCSSPS